MKSAVITGATGMLGRALTEKLLSQGIRVMLLVNPSSKRLESLRPDPLATVVACSIDELSVFDWKGDVGWDVFYHLAWGGTFGIARNDLMAQEANIRYALDAVGAAKRLGCRRFVGAGSQAEYGRVDGVLHPDTPTNPDNGYGIAKLAAGRMTRLYCEQLGLEHVWTRILSVYGPEDGTNTMVSSAIRAFLAGERPQFTPCEQQWDYLYRNDAAEALRLVGDYGRNGAVYPIGSGRARPLREYVLTIRDAVDPNLEAGIGELPYGERQVMHLCADIETLSHDTGFIPQVDFEEGIRATIEWMKRRDI